MLGANIVIALNLFGGVYGDVFSRGPRPQPVFSDPKEDSEKFQLTIIHTNDVHAHFMPSDQ